MTYQEIFQPLFEKLGFNPLKFFREGPRFFVVGGEYRQERVVFKSDVEKLKTQLPKAKMRLRGEAFFLEVAQLEHVPRFFAKGTHRGYFWVIEEWVPGESQELGESPFLFKPTFFTTENLRTVLGFWKALHELPRTNRTAGFRYFQEKIARRYTLADYASLATFGKESLVGAAQLRQIGDFVEKNRRFFDAHQTVITHHEFFAPHIFINRPELNVIDWENVGWGNPAYDFTELWMRSVLYPEFQQELEHRFRRQQPDPEVFDQLFRIERVLQGLGNLQLFATTQIKEEQRVADRMKEFLWRQLEEALAS